MTELTETQARYAQTEVLTGRVRRLSRQHDLTTDQRIGVCLALKVLETELAYYAKRQDEA